MRVVSRPMSLRSRAAAAAGNGLPLLQFQGHLNPLINISDVHLENGKSNCRSHNI